MHAPDSGQEAHKALDLRLVCREIQVAREKSFKLGTRRRRSAETLQQRRVQDCCNRGQYVGFPGQRIEQRSARMKRAKDESSAVGQGQAIRDRESAEAVVAPEIDAQQDAVTSE